MNASNPVLHHAGRVWRAAKSICVYTRYLKNGPSVWFKQKYNKALPPLKFRNGFTWYHGERDEPILLFREIFIERYYAPLDAPIGATVLDIGANIGAVCLFWAEGRPDLRFHAYEPNPQSFATLRQNIDNNRLSSHVTIYPEALGLARGQLSLWTDVPTTFATAYGDAPVEAAKKIAVPMITLDDAWDRMGRGPIFMLKIDTEGAEGDILEGASDAVLDNVQNACIEWHDNIVPGVFQRCCSRLEAAGFTYHTRSHPWDEGIIFASKLPLPGIDMT
ncbi:MAG: FkbM family methyltransferase [Beijerinckiaceae bacterium]|nr:FkbM family methyltransferase [Beijerinckiaceae bacterium]